MWKLSSVKFGNMRLKDKLGTMKYRMNIGLSSTLGCLSFSEYEKRARGR
jgi:hypothetical protein